MPSPIHFPRTLPVDEQLHLREWQMRSNDYNVLEQAFATPDVAESLDTRESLDALGPRGYAEFHVQDTRFKARRGGRIVSLACCVSETDIAVGGVILDFVHDEHPGEWEIGTWVLPGYRRQGVARRSARAVLKWLPDIGASKVWFQALDQRSAALAQQLGLEQLERPDYLEGAPGRQTNVFGRAISDTHGFA